MKMITKYEVYGLWSVKKDSSCPLCKAKLELVPKEGHYNSEYWGRQRDDGMLLYCCPEGCSLKKAEELYLYGELTLPIEKVKEDEIVYIDTLTWDGLTAGASHYYGKIRQFNDSGLEEYEVSVVLDEHMAAALSEPDYTYEVGDTSERFDSEKQLFARAAEVYKKHFPKAKVLVDGSDCAVEPQLVIDGPPNYKATNNTMLQKFRSHGEYTGNGIKVAKKWRKLFRK
ncbi:MAG: hypothetical protein KAR40_06205 [Candidatus Sabulitectum sp.]|nr:hypothetical protein [Candidatus Sabulitectum sp.]